MSTVILAGSIREANAYRLDTGKRFARYVATAAQLKTATEIIELPGFKLRRDRFPLEQARDSRLKYGRNVEHIDESDWLPPLKVVEAVVDGEVPDEGAVVGVYELDLTDDDVLDALKAALNDVGYTLRKLPVKTEAQVAVVDSPVDF